MKKILVFLVSVIIALSAVTVSAASGNVTYSGDSGNFIFAPGSEKSPTDLFPDFKDVMPGDSITQTITVKNNASNKVKVKIYMRSLGAHEDSVEFLSGLQMTVKKSNTNDAAYMFDATADKTAQLTEWVELGTLYSGGEVNLDVTLTVPTNLDNDFSSKVGLLDWEFKVEEFPIEESDPQLPQMGDNSAVWMWLIVLMGSAAALIAVVILRRKKDKNADE